jgi:hypothetical protein
VTTYTRRNRQTGTVLIVAPAAELDLDDEGGRWVTLCDDHGTLVNSDTRNAALSIYPLDFCDPCRRLDGWDFGEYVNGIIDREIADAAAHR